MTKLLYYDNPSVFEFDAKVIAVRTAKGCVWVELDQTAFYVEGGGQPSDKGLINGVEVLRVFQADGVVWHELIAGLGDASQVKCIVDTARRHEFSVQHTGQHILSQAFFRLFSAETSSFHLTENKVTIDLSHPSLTESQLEEAEILANSMLRRALPVKVETYASKDQLPERLRKLPTVEGVIRLIEIPDFDICPCGGTHVQNTSELGLIKVLGYERTKGKTKVEFACGDRAMREFSARLASDRGLAQLLSSPYNGHMDTVAKLQEREKTLSREVDCLTKELLELKAAFEQPVSVTGGVAYYRLNPWEGTLDEAKLYLSLVLKGGLGVGVAVLSGDPARIVVASSSDLNAAAVLKDVLLKHGGKGGGVPHCAQGGLPAASLDAALTEIEAIISRCNS